MIRCHKKRLNCTDLLPKLKWKSDLEIKLAIHVRMESLKMMMARLYELHHKNVMQYFGLNRIGNGIDDDVLVLCLECEDTDTLWMKLGKFLGCDFVLEDGWREKIGEFPWGNVGDDFGTIKEYLPREESLDWRRKWNITKDVRMVLDLMHGGDFEAKERMDMIAKKVLRFDMETQTKINE